MKIEAEAMNLLTGYRIESGSFASGEQFIGLAGGDAAETGIASFAFSGPSGLYKVVVGYFDEADGVSHLEVRKQGTLIDAWDFNKNLGSNLANTQTQTSRTIASNLLVNAGETIEIRGSENQGEPARIDYIEFIPVDTSPTSIRVEAEQMNLSTYLIESGINFASGNTLIRLPSAASGTSGEASFAFAGPSGTYDVIIGYLDENDGGANLRVSVGATSVAWDLNQDLGSAGAAVQALVRRTVASSVSINQGDTVQIQGTLDQSEWAQVDYLEFIPVSVINGTSAAETLTGDELKNTINGFGGQDTLIGGAGNDILNGGSGIDTVSYAQAVKGVIANLSEGFAFTSAYNSPLKIMPLGDSITYGVLGNSAFYDNASSGGYRIGLWNKFVADGLAVNFVGSQVSGPASLGDQDHEGHGGWKIETIAGSVDGFLSAAQPDVILLMIGTNDTRRDSLSTMINQLSALVDQITADSPNAKLLVTSIPPIHPDGNSAARVQLAKDFNRAIPGIINSKIAQGKQVTFVNTSSLTLNDLTSTTAPGTDNGLHLNAQGYGNLASIWRDAVLNTAGDKDTFSSIENVAGSDSSDVLMGNAVRNVIRGNAGNDTLTGGGDNDTLTGGAGNDTLTGGAGNDTLTGNSGVDIFVYQASTEGRDKITDFSSNEIFHISASGFGGGLQAGTALSTTDSSTGVFVSSLDPTPVGTSANFLYNTGTGLLSFDSDGTGSGTAVAIATLTGAPSLNANQFTIVS